MASTTTPLTFGDIVLILKRRFLIVASCVVLGIVAAVLANHVLPQSFQATASVSVNPIAVNDSGSLPTEDQLLSMPTEQQVISSAKVVELTLARLPLSSSMSEAELLRSYAVTVPKDSRVLTVTATGSSPRQAADIANAVALSYLSVRSDNAAASLSQAIQDTKTRLKALEAAAKSGTEIAQRSLQVQIDAMSSRLVSLNSANTQPGSVIATAMPPKSPTRPGLAIFGIGGAFLGLLAGASWVVLTARRHERVENVQRLESLGGRTIIDGSNDHQLDSSWDRIALILGLPESLGKADSYFVGVDGPATSFGNLAGQELADAGQRLGFETEFVDASRAGPSRINRGWPKRSDWAGRVVIFDTSNLDSEAHRVILLGRADSVLLARRAKDDLAVLRRFVEMLHARNTSIDVIALTSKARLLRIAVQRKRARSTVASIA